MERKQYLVCTLLCLVGELLLFLLVIGLKVSTFELVKWNQVMPQRLKVFSALSQSKHLTVKRCTNLTFPMLTDSRSRWLNVSHNEIAFVYSVYKVGNIFKFVGAAQRGGLSPFCQIWSREEMGRVSLASMHEANIIYLPESHQYKFMPCFFLCPISTSSEPYAVSLVMNNPCGTPLHAIQVSSTTRCPRRNFTVCVAPIYFQNPFGSELVEWIEFNRILGADFFVFYNHSVSKLDDKILSHYSKRGLAEVHTWNLRQAESTIHYHAQMSAINDCILRHRDNTEFIAVFDLDEFIIPRKKEDSTWNDMLKRLPKASSYIFRNVFFPRQWKTTKGDVTDSNAIKSHELLVLNKLQRESFIWENKLRSKTILNPRATDISGIHFVWEHSKGNSLDVDPAVGLVHHYRVWKESTGKIVKVTDTTVLKYQDILIKNVQTTLKDINEGRLV